MRFNEVLLIGGALLAAALVLSKGGESQQNLQTLFASSKVNLLSNQNANTKPLEKINTYPQKINLPNILTFANPILNIKLPTLETFKQFFPVTDTNVQLKKIIDIEKEERDQRVSYLQNELDQTNSYIREQQTIADRDQYNQPNPYRKYNFNRAYLYKSDVQNIENKYGPVTDDTIIQYYEDLIKSESALGFGGNATGGAQRKFPIITAALTNLYKQKLAIKEIDKAIPYSEKQQEGINEVLNEYTTRFGGLSRYD